MFRKILALPLLSLFLFPLVSSAKSLEGVTLPDSVTVRNQALVLNGMGLRKVHFLFVPVNVYVAGLYVESKINHPETVLTDGKVKRLDLRFLHDVSKDKLMTAWREGFEKNCDASLMNCSQSGLLLSKLEGAMSDVKTGDSMVFTFLPSGIVVVINNQPAKVITGGSDFSKIMLTPWFGKNPPNQELQDGLLGNS